MKNVKRAAILLLVCAALMMFSACDSNTKDGGGDDKSVDFSQVMGKVSESVGLDENMMDVAQQDIESLYGVAKDEYKQFAAKLSMTGLSADEIVFIEAESDEAADAIKSKIEARMESKLNETKNYLPNEYEKIKGSKVMKTGRYISFIVSDKMNDITEIFNDAIK